MSKFKNAEEFIETIEKRRSFRTDREALQAFLKKHGNPHLLLKTIHVAGTNGKGSVTNYISQILIQQGYKVGMFTSPYLVTHFDRIRTNDKNIPDETMWKLAETYWEDIEFYDLNMFEIDFVLSVIYFMEQNVDFAVYEVGMGGRLDATNAIVPLVCGITNIGMDHMQYLGDTYAQIALEKAGIMKGKVPCYTTEIKKECIEVMSKHAKEVGTVLKEVAYLPAISYPPLIVESDCGELELGEVALYQRENAALALAMVEELKKQGVCVDDDSIKQGIRTIWKGRFEKIRNNVYLDGAHNIEGVRALCQSIDAIRGKENVRIVFACLKDKPYMEMIELLDGHCDALVLTCIDNPRACRKEDYGENYQVVERYEEALKDALSNRDDLVFITGSLYFISLARNYIQTM